MDIVIYMNEEDFKHKTDTFTYDCYWTMKRFPKRFTEHDKIFIAAKGVVQGFVECMAFNPTIEEAETLVWDGDSFEKIYPIPCKPFRGFRYKWWRRNEKRNS